MSDAADRRTAELADRYRIERVALVGTLSEELWARPHRPLPTYTRATMPIILTPLHVPSPRDQDS